MKAFTTLGTAVLFLGLAAAVPAFAQEEQHEQEAKPEKQAQQAKPAQQEKQAKPEAQAEQVKPAQQEKQAKPEAQAQQAKPEAQAQQAKPEAQAEQAKPAQQEKQANSEKQEPQTKQAKQEPGKTEGQQPAQRSAADEQKQRAVPALRLSARGSGRIPEDRFRANFGQGHRFVIEQPVIVGGYSRFQYGGYWFGFVQPWPVGWYYTDQVYVDYIDAGYYLCNPFYPGVRVSISVVL